MKILTSVHGFQRWLNKASALWLPLALCLTVTPSHAGPICYETTFKTNRPLWVSSATWVNGLSELVIVDPMQNQLLAYDADGVPKPSPPLKLKSAEVFEPTAVSALGDKGFLLELSDGAVVRLSDTLSVRDEQPIRAREKNAKGYRLGSLYQWKTAGDYIVAYGSLLKGEELARGFFRLKLSAPENPEMLTPEADSSFYLIGNNYIATIGDTAYYVVMANHPAIYKATPGRPVERLKSFPEDPSLQTRPDFTTRMAGPNSAGKHFAELESFTVVSGLYSQGKDLFLLARKPEAQGKTGWFLYKIDPDDKKPVGPPVRLPTSANHLTVVPGKDSWILIEKGAVKSPQGQLIDKMVVITASSIASMAPLPSTCSLR